MIRRSPTRLELKFEDIQEFEFVQKSDRKKSLVGVNGTEETKKLIRQERIGYTAPPTTNQVNQGAQQGTVAPARSFHINTTGIRRYTGFHHHHHPNATVAGIGSTATAMQPRPGATSATTQATAPGILPMLPTTAVTGSILNNVTTTINPQPSEEPMIMDEDVATPGTNSST